jgi:hypothetical protein
MQKEEGYNDDTNHVYKKALLEDFSIKMDTLAVPRLSLLSASWS